MKKNKELNLRSRKSISLILIAFLVNSSLSSQAGSILTSLNGFYYNKNIIHSDDTVTDSTQSFLSLNISYLTSSRFILGVNSISDSTDSGPQIEKVTGYGPSLGYLFGSWVLEGTALSQMEYSPNSSSSQKWKEGSGYQVSLCFLSLGNLGVFWGFQWVYRAVDYKKYFDGQDFIENKRKVSETFPQVKIGYAF